VQRLDGLSLRMLRHRRGRVALTGVGIALGVAMLVGALLANASIVRGFDEASRAFAGDTDVIAVPLGARTATLDADAIAELGRLPSVDAVQPLVVFPTSVAHGDRDTPISPNGFPPVVVGLDFATAGSAYDVRLARGRTPAAGAAEALVSDGLADRLGIDVGDRVQVATPSGVAPLTVVGRLAPSGIGLFNFGRAVFADLGWARDSAGQAGAASLVGIQLDDGVDPSGWIAEHEAGLSGRADLRLPAQLDETTVALVRSVGSLFTGVAGIVLFVAAFIIYLTLTMAVGERVRVYGILGALGATRRQIVRLVLVESVALGAVATAVGLLVGVALAVPLVAIVGGLYEVATLHVSLTLVPFLVGVAVGVVTSAVAAVAPARRAGRLDPITAIAGDPGSSVRGGRTWWLGAVLIAAGAAVGLGWRGSGAGGAVASVLLLTGSVLVVPAVLRPLAAVTGRVTAPVAPGVGSIAVLHLRKERSRSAYTLALVMVVLAMILGIGAVYGSVTGLVDRTADVIFGSDLQLVAASTFDDGVVADVAAVPGVAAVARLYPVGETTVATAEGAPGDRAGLRVIDAPAYFDVAGLPWVDGGGPRAERALAAGSTVALPVAVARQQGLGVGDEAWLRTLAGPRPFEVVGTYAAAFDAPPLYVGSTGAAELFGIDQPSQLYVDVADGADVGAVGARIHRDLDGRTAFLLQTSDDAKATIRATAGGVFVGFWAVLAVAGGVGLLGLGNTLVISMLQRRREIGILRALGTYRRQVSGLVLVECATLVAVAVVLALPLGAALGRLLIGTVDLVFAGAADEYRFPWRWIPVVALAGAAFAVAGSLVPARRAVRLDVIEALADE
jgi:putative ABC transport system permease protein